MLLLASVANGQTWQQVSAPGSLHGKDSVKWAKQLNNHRKTANQVLSNKQKLTPDAWQSVLVLGSVASKGQQPDSLAKYWPLLHEAVKLYPTLPAKARLKLRTQQSDSSVVLAWLHTWELQLATAAKQDAQARSYRGLQRYTILHPDPKSPELPAFLTDSLRYLELVTLRNADSLEAYIQSHPASRFKATLENLAIDLRFREETGSGKLEDLVRYYVERPTSPYREQVLSQIMLRQTFASNLANLETFALDQRWELTTQAKQAALLTSLLASQQGVASKIPQERSWQLPAPLPVPYGRWAWLSDTAQILTVDSLEEENCSQRWPHLAYGRTANSLHLKFLNGADTVLMVDSLQYLGSGWYQTYEQGGYTARFMDGTLTIRLLNTTWDVLESRFLIAKQGDSLSLYSLLGQRLLPGHRFTNIEYQEGVLLLYKGETLALLPENKLVLDGHQQPTISYRYTEAEDLRPNRWLVQQASGEKGIVTSDGVTVIPFGKQTISNGPRGTWVCESSTGFRVLTAAGKAIHQGYLEAIKSGAYSIAYRQGDKWGVIGADGEVWQPAIWDTVLVLAQQKLIVKQGNITLLEVGPGRWTSLCAKCKAQVLAPPTTTDLKQAKGQRAIVAIEDSAGVVSLYNRQGQRLNIGPLKRAWRVSAGLMAVEQEVQESQSVTLPASKPMRGRTKTKKVKDRLVAITKTVARVGLIDTTGKQVLPPVYSGITTQNSENLMLLRDGFFGMYYIPASQVIEPRFTQNLLPLEGTNLLIAVNDTGAGIYERNGKQVLPHFARQFQKWTNKQVLATTAAGYRLISLATSARPKDDTTTRPLLKQHQFSNGEGLMAFGRSNIDSTLKIISTDGRSVSGTDIGWRLGKDRGHVWVLRPRGKQLIVDLHDHRLNWLQTYAVTRSVWDRLQCEFGD